MGSRARLLCSVRGMADELVSKGRTEDAIQVLTEAVDWFPPRGNRNVFSEESFEGLTYLGNLRRSKILEFGEELASQGRIDALTLFDELVWFEWAREPEEQPELAKALIQLGSLQAQIGQFDEALKSFRRVYKEYWGEKEDDELRTLSAWAWVEKCLVLFQTGKIDEAAEDLIDGLSQRYWEEEGLAGVVVALKRIPSICRDRTRGEVDSFLRSVSNRLSEIEDLVIRDSLTSVLELCRTQT